jgi:hypothetical protein
MEKVEMLIAKQGKNVFLLAEWIRSVTGRVRPDIQFEANISEYKRICICFEANKTCFICLFRIEANQWILHEKRIKNGTEYSLLSKYFLYFASKRIV